MRSVRVSATICSLFLIALGGSGAVAPAQADFRWDWELRVPRFDVFPDREYYVDDNYQDEAYYNEDEEPIVRKPRRKKQAEQWWTYEDENMDPVYEPPVYKSKKKRIAKIKPKIVAQKSFEGGSEPLTDIASARAKFGKKPAMQSASLDTVPKFSPKPKTKIQPVLKPKPLPTAGNDKQDKKSGKTIGCTAGAAVVTGYGFGNVRPKACTGATYAYDAARGGKPYLIKLNAASGEILDVKRLN